MGCRARGPRRCGRTRAPRGGRRQPGTDAGHDDHAGPKLEPAGRRAVRCDLYLVDAETLRTVEGPLSQDNFTFGLAVDGEHGRIAVAAVNRVVTWSLRFRRTADGQVGLADGRRAPLAQG
jgi:hypothetical protein